MKHFYTIGVNLDEKWGTIPMPFCFPSIASPKVEVGLEPNGPIVVTPMLDTKHLNSI